eukprot:TRINITY_DN85_c1_g1_i1.p1 TRINITY_DN85_c1_g1~~TRINITY_DN85_c1_g1_i1.p1  ORF type:complete len:437 (+),score=157.66 TRINITY_DN85_c1_g1_i1:404-1714(+)
MAMKPPHKIDANLYGSRCQLEEIADLFKAPKSTSMEGILRGALAVVGGVNGVDVKTWSDDISSLIAACGAACTMIEQYQKDCVGEVETLLKTFLPQGFRASVVTYFRERSEQRYAAEQAQLLSSGGTIQAKFDLLWKQQLERRQSLVNIGNVTGTHKAFIKYIGGVPQCLLDFIKTVNDENGPMEEMRATYGPYQYELTTLINRTRQLCALLYGTVTIINKAKSLPKQTVTSLLTLVATKTPVALRTLQQVQQSLSNFYKLLVEILRHSPFFLTKADIDALTAKKGAPITVVVSTNQSVRVPVKTGDSVSWEFTTDKDIKFRVSTETTNGETVVVPLALVNSHEAPVKGSHDAAEDGSVHLFWDNSYSWFSSKNLTYRVSHTEKDKPAEGTPAEAQPTAEEAAAAASVVGEGGEISQEKMKEFADMIDAAPAPAPK